MECSRRQSRKGRNRVRGLGEGNKRETGLGVPEEKLKYLRKVFVKYPDYDFEHHIFSLKLDRDYQIMINTAEHQGYRWVTLDEALSMNLVRDAGVCLQTVYGDQKEI